MLPHKRPCSHPSTTAEVRTTERPSPCSLPRLCTRAGSRCPNPLRRVPSCVRSPSREFGCTAQSTLNRQPRRYLAFEHVDRLVATHRHEESAIRRVATDDSLHAAQPHSVHEILVVGIRVVEDEGRTLVERHQHVIGRTHQTEGTAGTEVHTVHASGMARELAQIGSHVPGHSTDRSRRKHLPPHTFLGLLHKRQFACSLHPTSGRGYQDPQKVPTWKRLSGPTSFLRGCSSLSKAHTRSLPSISILHATVTAVPPEAM